MSSNRALHTLPHILVQNTASREDFTHPSGGGGALTLPSRDRRQHGRHLQSQLVAIGRQSTAPTESGIQPIVKGTYVEFESEPQFKLKIEGLEDIRRGIEVVAVKKEKVLEGGELMKATVFVREGQLSLFTNKIEKYLTSENNRTQRPKNKDLVESISNIRVSQLSSLWTDTIDFPSPDQMIWWEVWLRAGNNESERRAILRVFREQTERHQLITGPRELPFPENTVALLQATPNQIERLIYPLDILSELRGAKVTPNFFLEMDREQEYPWVEDIAGRVVPPDESAPAVCLLDTGVNYEHPLLVVALDRKDMDSYISSWGISDDAGHGTEMAGIGLYGDLFELLTSRGTVQLNHRLESVKMLPPRGVGDNPPELYGDITRECVARAEIFAPERQRVICLATTTIDFRDRGQPSSWSGAIDALCSGAFEEESPKRLILISGGNTDYAQRSNYPSSNQTEGIHDPAQSWNAVTVGAYTDKVIIHPEDELPDSVPLAPKGGLCPSSTTSLIWDRQWPFKPDIVLEGGNMATHSTHLGPFEHPSLQLLTTNADWQRRFLTEMRETSAATALASRMAAIIFAEYPDFWPETVRGLLIHSADWTSQMLSEFAQPMTPKEKGSLLRTYGYGVPSIERALYSANNSLTLIAQNELTPFKQEGSAIKTNEMHIHELPWPKDVLLNMGDIPVQMRVTLSYFIDPNPSRRGFKKRHQYSSHGLRFDTKSAIESLDDFRRRVNKVARNEVADFEGGASDAEMWVLGPHLRTRGSVHSDTWRGAAYELGLKEYVAVYPVGGWWKDLKREASWDSVARYSLIVTISTPEEDVDIYTPIVNLINV